MSGRTLKSYMRGFFARVARAIVARGLRPQVAALLSQSYQGAVDTLSDRDAIRWLLHHGLPPGVVDLLTASGSLEARKTASLSTASREWATWIARDCTSQFEDGSLRMPLVNSINSDEVTAPFFAGENIQIMQGTIVSPDSNIGGNTYIGFNSHVTKTNIGRYVSIADGALIGPGEHFVDQVSTSSLFYAKPYATLTQDDCRIHDDVWVGASSIIRRGVTIGIGAVVGANSFVNRDVEPFSIVAGSPARCIGYRFSQEQIDKILESRWWELPVPEARSCVAKLTLEFKNSK